MPRVDPALTSFNAGEFSSWLIGRPELTKYSTAARSLLNFIPRTSGAAQRRPGTQFAGQAKNETARQLLEFEVNNTINFVIEAGDGYFRFWHSTRQQIMDAAGTWAPASTGTPAELLTHFGLGVGKLQTAQSNDVMWIVDGFTLPMKLSRIAQYKFQIANMGAVPNLPGPVKDVNPDSPIFLVFSAQEGAGVLVSASAPLFTSAMVGEGWRCEAPANDIINPWEVGQVIGGVGIVRFSFGRNYVSLNAGTTGTQRPVHSFGARFDGGPGSVQWEYSDDNYGDFEIKAVAPGGLSATIDINKKLPVTLTVGPGSNRWQRAAWNADDGYPNAVAFFRERLCFARGQTFWASVQGDFENFQTRDGGLQTDLMSISITLASARNDRIRWLRQAGGATTGALIAGTASTEYAIRENAPQDPFSPNNIRAVPVSSFGSGDTPPVQVGEALIFIQAGGRKVRELVYDIQVDSFASHELTRFADHIAPDRGFIRVCYQRQPDPIAWFVSQERQRFVSGSPTAASSSFHSLTYDRAEEVFAWAPHVLGGTGPGNFGGPMVYDMAVVIAPDTVTDDVWMLTGRFAGSAQGTFLEVMGPVADLNGAANLYHPNENLPEVKQACYLDFSERAAIAANATSTTLPWLPPGMVATGLVEGYVTPAATTGVGGTFAIEPDAAARTGRFGFNYLSTLWPMPLHGASRAGAPEGKRSRVVGAFVRVYKSVGFLFGHAPNPPQGHLTPVPKFDRMEMRKQNTPMNVAVPLQSGDFYMAMPGGYTSDSDNDMPGVCVRQDQPLPLNVLAIFPKLSVEDD